MNGDRWIAFVVLVSAIVLTPGPSVLLVTAHGASFGFRPTLATICGDLSANVCQMTLATVGLSALEQTSPLALEILKWIGVLYLVFLGARMWSLPAKLSQEMFRSSPCLRRRLYSEGLMASALNPKALCFFFALFPQFLDPSCDTRVECAVFGSTFVCLDGLALLAYARGAAKMADYLAAGMRQHWLGRLGGLFLIGAAILLACWDV